MIDRQNRFVRSLMEGSPNARCRELHRAHDRRRPVLLAQGLLSPVFLMHGASGVETWAGWVGRGEQFLVLRVNSGHSRAHRENVMVA